MVFTKFEFVALLAQLLIFAAGLWLWFWLTKAAIREGIKESGLVDAVRASRSKSAAEAALPEWAKRPD